MKTLILFNLKRRLFNRMNLLINAVLLLAILFGFHADYFLGNDQSPPHFYVDDSTKQFQSAFLSRERNYQIYNGPIGETDILIHYDGGFIIISNSPPDADLLDGIRQDIQQAVRETYSRQYPALKPFVDDYASIRITISVSSKPEERLWILASAVYFLLMNYSSTIASEVVYEKTNHLLESQLTALTAQQHLLSKIIQGYLMVIIQLLAVAVFTAAAFFLRWLEDGLSGLRNFLNTNEIMKADVISLPVSWQTLVLIGAIMVSGLMIVQTLMLLVCSRLSSSEQAASLQGVFYVLLLVGYYLLLSYGSQWIVNATREIQLLAGLPVVSIYLMSGLLLMGKASLSQGLLALGINLVTLLLMIEFSGRQYRENLLKI